MSYYGIILINTSLMTLFTESPTNAVELVTTPSKTCRMLTSEDYQSMIFTTLGEMLGIPLLLFFLAKFGRRDICTINFSSACFCFTCFLLIPRQQSWMVNLVTFLARMFISAQFSLMYLYTMEVYPTVIRAVAVGCASSMARIGAMITPYLAQVLIRQTFYGTIAVYIGATGLAACFAFLLPIETRGRELKVSRNGFRRGVCPIGNAHIEFSQMKRL